MGELLTGREVQAHALNRETGSLRPHDLLWLASPAALRLAAPRPAWADDDWLRRAPVVVRREHIDDPSLVPVGVRGRVRSERAASYVRRADIVRRVTPEALARDAFRMRGRSLHAFRPILALMSLAPVLNAIGLAWGPTGGAGFALASGLPVLHEGSDLDLVLRASAPLAPGQVNALRCAFSKVACRVDAQVDTGAGGFSFSEWTSGARRVLLRTVHAPLLAANPWDPSRLSGVGGEPASGLSFT